MRFVWDDSVDGVGLSAEERPVWPGLARIGSGAAGAVVDAGEGV